MAPVGLKYLQTHEWVLFDKGSNLATIGISDFAAEHLGDIVYLELPEPGDKIVKGESFGVVESVKAASDLYAAVDGEIVEVNEALTDELETISQDAFGAGWMIKVEVDDPSGLDALMDQSAYDEFLKNHADDE